MTRLSWPPIIEAARQWVEAQPYPVLPTGPRSCSGKQVELLGILDIERPVPGRQGDQALGSAVQNPRGLMT
jgi:hypothetical protein